MEYFRRNQRSPRYSSNVCPTHLSTIPMPASWTGETPVAVGDWNGDSLPDYSLAAGPRVFNFSGKDGSVISTYRHERPFSLGPPSIALGRVNADAFPDLIVADGEFPLVEIVTPVFGQNIFGKFPEGSTFPGGIRVASADLNADGVLDMIMGSGAGGGGTIATCTGTNGGLLDFFDAFSPPTPFAIFVAGGDVNRDGKDDVIASLGLGGPPQVKVFNATNHAVLHSFFAYDPSFTGGVTVASGDFNNDGLDDIVTGSGPGMSAQVKVFSGSNLVVLRNFAPELASFTGGTFVAAGDLDGDGIPEIVTGTGAAPPMVRVFNGVTLAPMASFSPYATTFAGGVRVAVSDVDGDSTNEIVCSPGPGMVPEVRCFDFPSLSRVRTFLAYPATFTGGVFVSSGTLAPASVKMTDFRTAPNSKLQITLQCPKGRSCYLDSSTDGVAWSQLATRPGTGLADPFLVDIVSGSRRLYRGRSR